ncbi:MAG: PTS sugar transporter subunit IIA [Spirochaetia bacterium]
MEKPLIINPEQCSILSSADREGAIGELIKNLQNRQPELDVQAIHESVWSRENQLSTRLTENTALPHAQMDSLNDTYLVVGLSREGIIWDIKDNTPVHLVFLLVGPPETHLKVLSKIAEILKNGDVTTKMLSARNSIELYEAFTGKCRGEIDQGKSTQDGALLESAFTLARKIRAAAVFSHGIRHLPETAVINHAIKLIQVLPDEEYIVPTDKDRDDLCHLLTIPFKTGFQQDTSQISLLLALSKGLVSEGDSVIHVYGSSSQYLPGSITIDRADQSFSSFFSKTGVSEDFFGEQVFLRVLKTAQELSVEGREGKPVGTIFLLGDYENVKKRCRQLIMNPFRGYPESERNIMDPSLAETIKEFSRIDGATVIREDGAVMSAGTYIIPGEEITSMPGGLGARHAAAAGITAVTDCIAVALSESTRRISLFRRGERALDRLILPK